MNLYLRLMFTWLRSLRARSIHPTASCDCAFRVLPHDIDVFGHMNNGRFFQIMDVARFDWMLRTGVWKAIRGNGWQPALGGSLIHYRRALRPFSRFSVRTRLLGYEGPWILLEHTFINEGGQIAAVACTRASMRAQGRMVGGRAVFESIDASALALEPPEYVLSWLAADRSLYGDASSPTLLDESALPVSKARKEKVKPIHWPSGGASRSTVDEAQFLARRVVR